MDVQEALARAESWRNSPGIRPEPVIAREVAATLASELSRVTRAKDDAETGLHRYEAVRKLNVQQFADLYLRNIEDGVPFDQLVDELKI